MTTAAAWGRRHLPILVMTVISSWVASALASNCNITSVNKVPINDLGSGLYLNQFQGGLYPGGSNVVPASHAQAGAQRAAMVQPLNAQGQPSADGRYVFLSIGM